MKEWYKDFIGIYENVFSEDYCNSIIKIFEDTPIKQNRQSEQNVPKTEINDNFINICDVPENVKNFATNKLQYEILNLYLKQYNTIHQNNNLFVFDFKIQKTKPTEGYHMWHSEWSPYMVPVHEPQSFSNICRTLVWILYLNDIEEGGETEFLYQSLRVKPKMGSVCIFPAYFTHTHRGNPPLKENKYIITGWINSKVIRQVDSF